MVNFKNNLDTLKLYVKQHGSKSQNLIINLDEDGVFEDGMTLEEARIENETEISFYNQANFLEYKLDPKTCW